MKLEKLERLRFLEIKNPLSDPFSQSPPPQCMEITIGGHLDGMKAGTSPNR
jgi:hypothetical protein